MSPRQAPGWGQEEGNAQVEFIGWVVMVLVPVVYLVVALAGVQAASFAVDSAAQSAARTLSTHPGAKGSELARASVYLALSDQGVEAERALGALSLDCERPGCAGGHAVARVSVGVDLPVLSQVGIGREVVQVSASRSVRLAEPRPEP